MDTFRHLTTSLCLLTLFAGFAMAENDDGTNAKKLEELKKKQAEIVAMPGNTVTERTTSTSKAKPPLSAEGYCKLTTIYSDQRNVIETGEPSTS